MTTCTFFSFFPVSLPYFNYFLFLTFCSFLLFFFLHLFLNILSVFSLFFSFPFLLLSLAPILSFFILVHLFPLHDFLFLPSKLYFLIVFSQNIISINSISYSCFLPFSFSYLVLFFALSKPSWKTPPLSLCSLVCFFLSFVLHVFVRLFCMSFMSESLFYCYFS